MQYHPLGSSGVNVSRVCLGSMTWGKQNTQSDADEQIAYALEQGVNFIDTARNYADSEAIVGKTLKVFKSIIIQIYENIFLVILNI